MKKFPVIIAIVLNLFLATALPAPAESAGISALRADFSSAYTDIKETFREIRETWEGIGRFIDGISGGIKAISRVIDPGALILLAAVLLFSAGFSAIGVPRGRAAFFASLITLNSLWLLWEKSMHPGSYGFLLTMLKINFILLLPYFLIVLFYRTLSSLLGRAWRRCVRWFRISILKRAKEKEEMIFLSDSFRESGRLVNESLARDIASGGEKKMTPSALTRRHLENLLHIIRKIED